MLVTYFLAESLKNMHRDWRDQGNELWEKVNFSGMKKMRPILKNTGYVLTDALQWAAAKYLIFTVWFSDYKKGVQNEGQLPEGDVYSSQMPTFNSGYSHKAIDDRKRTKFTLRNQEWQQ